MAISYWSTKADYIGLSTDDKTPYNSQEGAIIYYTDLKKKQINHGGVWVDYVEATSITNGSLPNQVQEITVVAGLAITDTSSHSYVINTSTIGGRKSFIIVNTLNQTASVTFYGGTATSLPSSPLGSATNVLSGAAVVVGSNNAVSFGDPYSQMRAVITCSTAPTSGVISITCEGVSI